MPPSCLDGAGLVLATPRPASSSASSRAPDWVWGDTGWALIGYLRAYAGLLVVNRPWPDQVHARAPAGPGDNAPGLIRCLLAGAGLVPVRPRTARSDGWLADAGLVSVRPRPAPSHMSAQARHWLWRHRDRPDRIWAPGCRTGFGETAPGLSSGLAAGGGSWVQKLPNMAHGAGGGLGWASASVVHRGKMAGIAPPCAGACIDSPYPGTGALLARSRASRPRVPARP